MTGSVDTLNVLRHRLEEPDGVKHGFREQFAHIESWSYDAWVPALLQDRGSHAGPSHLKGVERQVCDLISEARGVHLSAAESFVMLLAILLHDLGKAASPREAAQSRRTRGPASCEWFSGIPRNSPLRNPPGHALVSADFIMRRQDHLGLRDKEIAYCIATIAAAHEQDIARELKRRHGLEDRFLDRFGRIRIAWLCALLALADELDTSYHRVAEQWTTPPKDHPRQKPSKGQFRTQLRGCEVDLRGRLLVIHPDHRVADDLKNDQASKFLGRALTDLHIKRRLLKLWSPELRQMRLVLADAALCVEGHLLSTRTAGSPRARRAGALKTRSGRARSPISLELVVEPNIREMKVDRILDAALRLRFNSFGRTSFPWETLATESGTENVHELKAIFHRLLMLARVFFAKDSSALVRCLRRFAPKAGGALRSSLVFIELDGEWTIHMDGAKSGRGAERAIRAFYRWVSRIVAIPGSRNPHTRRPGVVGRQLYEVRNPEMAYLLEELGLPPKRLGFPNRPRGIVLPASQSLLFGRDGGPPVGINIVLTGPPGVGKSTLAMEFLSRGEMLDERHFGSGRPNRRSVFAYFSLEQPIDLIRELAKSVGIDERHIVGVQLHHGLDAPLERTPGYVKMYRDIVRDAKSDRLYFLPNLSPRTYADSIDEEQLYWFRYKQVARLLEAHRCFVATEGNASLDAIVLDNLNAFSRHSLGRQRIHQLFRLISWAGVLGIHIVEDDRTNEAQSFRKEAEYLADIVIRLDWRRDGYMYKTIEIEKSRSQRNVLGPHPFKIRRESLVRDKEESKPHPKSHSAGSRAREWGDGRSPAFEIYLSMHTQMSRTEKGDAKPNSTPACFAANRDLRHLVHKEWTDRKRDLWEHYDETAKGSGITHDAFVVLRGRQGAHKLAIAMSYVFGGRSDECALVLNMGQPIDFDNVAGRCDWRKRAKCSAPLEPEVHWRHEKVDVNVRKRTRGSAPILYVMDFHAGFLLPEEFIHIVTSFLDKVGEKVGRVLLNSTGQLPQRFPLLHREPLLLTTLARILKTRGIGLMVIAVEGTKDDDRIIALSEMSDLKVTVYQANDDRLSEQERNLLRGAPSGSCLISSDNITGKDYRKKYRILEITPGTAERGDRISLKPPPEAPAVRESQSSQEMSRRWRT